MAQFSQEVKQPYDLERLVAEAGQGKAQVLCPAAYELNGPVVCIL